MNVVVCSDQNKFVGIEPREFRHAPVTKNVNATDLRITNQSENYKTSMLHTWNAWSRKFRKHRCSV